MPPLQFFYISASAECHINAFSALPVTVSKLWGSSLAAFPRCQTLPCLFTQLSFTSRNTVFQLKTALQQCCTYLHTSFLTASQIGCLQFQCLVISHAYSFIFSNRCFLPTHPKKRDVNSHLLSIFLELVFSFLYSATHIPSVPWLILP